MTNERNSNIGLSILTLSNNATKLMRYWYRTITKKIHLKFYTANLKLW